MGKKTTELLPVFFKKKKIKNAFAFFDFDTQKISFSRTLELGKGPHNVVVQLGKGVFIDCVGSKAEEENTTEK